MTPYSPLLAGEETAPEHGRAQRTRLRVQHALVRWGIALGSIAAAGLFTNLAMHPPTVVAAAPATAIVQPHIPPAANTPSQSLFTGQSSGVQLAPAPRMQTPVVITATS